MQRVTDCRLAMEVGVLSLNYYDGWKIPYYVIYIQGARLIVFIFYITF